MSDFRLNGKNVSTEELIETLQKDTTKITSVGITFDNPKKDPTLPLTNDGFDIPKHIIGELSAAMDEYGADRLIYIMSGSPYIKGRNLILTMEDPRPEPTRFKKALIRIGKWLQD